MAKLIADVKRMAHILKNSLGIKYSDALNRIAKLYKYNSFEELVFKQKNKDEQIDNSDNSDDDNDM